MKERLFPILIALSALSVSASAAFYSVFGLSKLFAGASYQVMVMAASLEFAKLVVASLLYQYWSTINKWLRFYLSLAVFVLIVITSGGIYGFLSGAYQETATKSELLDKGLKVLELKQTRFEEQKNDLSVEKEQLNKSISDLRLSLSNPAQVQYIDRTSGQLITTTSSSARRALQKELDKTIVDRDSLNVKLSNVQDSIIKFDKEILNLEISNEDQRELGPLKYLAEVTGKPMNQVVNWFLLLIIFVFDPLAIAMVIAANFAFSKLNKKKYKKDDTPDLDEVESKVGEEESKAERVKAPTPQPTIITEEEIERISTLVGKEENKLQPIKPDEEDLKKLEEVLGLSKKNNDVKFNKENRQKTVNPELQDSDTNREQEIEKEKTKKVLSYSKRSGNKNKK